MEKGCELPDGHTDRKFKGRVVFLGDRVKDGEGKFAVFEELSSSPGAMSAGKFADAYGCMPGNTLQTAEEHNHILVKLLTLQPLGRGYVL